VTWLARRSRRWATWRVALQAAGADLPDVVKTTVYIATQRRQDPLAAWEVVSRHFGDHDPPGTLLGVSVLGYRDQLVEVEAVAAQPLRRSGPAN
jgi:enamine deaminase RidA (YjgF/YER057c/UK114 family)